MGEDNKSFKSWFFSAHEWVEKTIGVIILVGEIFSLIEELLGGEERLFITHWLNLLFLIYIYFVLKNDFKEKFSVDLEPNIVENVFRIKKDDQESNLKLNKLITESNIFISQFKNITFFIISTASIYVLLLIKNGLIILCHANPVHAVLLEFLHQSHESMKAAKEDIEYIFHFLTDIASYTGAFFLLRCFYVMYLPTIDENGKDILEKRTSIYIIIGIFLMLFDYCIVKNDSDHGVFIAELICGIVNSIVFILFIARFENKILDIPPLILCILYLYSVLQVCLPFVTGDSNNISSIFDPAFAKDFKSIVLTVCLFGKVTLAAVLLYVLKFKRLFYYFMILRIIHKDEETNWELIENKIQSTKNYSESIELKYNYNSDMSYLAFIPEVPQFQGNGETPEAAKDDLLNQIKSKAHD